MEKWRYNFVSLSFSTRLVVNQVLSVKSFNGRKQFDIQVQNPNSRLSGEDPDVRHIYFPVHPEMANGRILAGGHDCGSCHNYAWWDTFDEVTITASAPTNNDPYVPDWWGGTSVYSYVSYIENKLTNPCFNNVFNQMRKGRFDNEVQKILDNFNKSSNLSFSIKNAPTMSDGNTQKAAETLGNLIVLNSTLMANASQEFVTATIYHEVLHVYINNTETYDHNTMSSKYVTPMIQALMSWFPLTYEHAEALAWSGLQTTPAYPQSKRSNTNSINNKYLNRTYGHTCQ